MSYPVPEYVPPRMQPGAYLPSQPPRRPRHPEAKLPGFTWRDWLALAVYISTMFLGVLSLVFLIPGVAELFNGDELAASIALNLANYALVLALVLFAAGPEFLRSFRTFLWYPWAKYFGIPVGWFATLMTTAVVLAVNAAITGDSPSVSQNQQDAQEMISAAPFLLMFVMVALMGPLVEEYVFRHLFVGKLSRWVNKWVLVVASAAVFMSLHFIGKEWPSIATGAPYFVMGIAFGVGYVLTGKSLAYSYVMHAFSNGMALVMSYALAPLLPAGAPLPAAQSPLLCMLGL